MSTLMFLPGASDLRRLEKAKVQLYWPWQLPASPAGPPWVPVLPVWASVLPFLASVLPFLASRTGPSAPQCAPSASRPSVLLTLTTL